MMILSISLGTRDSGIAIQNKGQLILWKMRNFTGKWSQEKLDEILKLVDRYIVQYRVDQVVVKIPPSTHHSKACLLLLKKLTELAQYRDCPILCLTKADIKSLVPEVINTKTLMEYVVRAYPILLPEQAQELASKRPYHTKMFEAVVAAHVFKESLG